MPRNRKPTTNQTQLSQPKGVDKDGKPWEPLKIPVPTETQVMDAFERIADVEKEHPEGE
jgi:hypothetical protein